MRLAVEIDRCCGHARCATIAPDIYVLNDVGYLDTPFIEVPAGEEPLAERGMRACPERCISLVEE